MHFQIWSFTYIAGYLSCRMTDIEGFLTIYGHSDNLLNNNAGYLLCADDIYHVEGFLAIYGHSDNLFNNKYVYISNSNEIVQKEKRCIAFNEFKCFQFRLVGPAIVCAVTREDRQNRPESNIIVTKTCQHDRNNVIIVTAKLHRAI